MHDLSSLSARERQAIFDFLLCHMTMDIRLKLMAEMPLAYVKIYGGRTSDTVLSEVSLRLDKLKS